jgi:hypothetical protein
VEISFINHKKLACVINSIAVNCSSLTVAKEKLISIRTMTNLKLPCELCALVDSTDTAAASSHPPRRSDQTKHLENRLPEIEDKNPMIQQQHIYDGVLTVEIQMKRSGEEMYGAYELLAGEALVGYELACADGFAGVVREAAARLRVRAQRRGAGLRGCTDLRGCRRGRRNALLLSFLQVSGKFMGMGAAGGDARGRRRLESETAAVSTEATGRWRRWQVGMQGGAVVGR